MDKILDAIYRERAYQDTKRPGRKHPVSAWLLIMRKELDEAEEAWVRHDGDSAALREILQVIAVGIACLEQHGVVER